MKKYFYCLAALALTVVSCNKELDNPQEGRPVHGAKKAISLSVEGKDVKTFVQDPVAGTIYWEDGDQIGVFTDVDTDAPILFSMSDYTGATATFSGEISDGATAIYAFYPYDASATFADGKITTSLPAVQSIGDHNVAHGAMLAIGTATKSGDDWSVTLKNAFSYLRFKIQTEEVKEIVLSAGSDFLAGSASFSVADASISGTGTSSTISITKAEGYFSKDDDYYIPVLPGAVAELSFSMTSNTHGENSGTEGYDDWKAERVVASSLTFTRGTGLKFDALDADGATNKWTWYFDIHDAASLERFRALVGAGNFPEGGLAKFTSDIDLSGVTLAAEAGTFTGTLDGQNHSITNWTSVGVPLFNLIGRDSDPAADGVVKNFTLASSCTLTFSFTNTGSRAGFIARYLNNHGTLEGITSNAVVTPVEGDVDGMYAGILAGVSYGLIQNCVNNSDISITASSMTGNMYLGAFAGYVNNGSNLALSYCTNNGDISYTVNSTAKQTYLGGIAGGTSISKVSEASMKGIADHCVNTGNISYMFTNGGSMEDNQGTGGNGNYFKVGGVVGYFDGDVTNCVNGVEGDATKGNVSVRIPTNESTACGTGVSLGGVAAFVSQNVTGCTNYGKVSFKGTCAGGTDDASGAGVKADPEFGGVVAQAGKKSDNGSNAITDCHNYGPMDINSWMATGNGTNMYFGGIVAYCKIPVTSCTNNAKITIVTKAAASYAGGVCGQGDAAGCTTLTNNGELDVTLFRSTGGDPSTYKQCAGSYQRLGGVMGYASSGIARCTNNGKVKVTGSTNAGIYCPLIGGITGQASSSFGNCVNTGDIEVSHPTDGTNGLRVGGLIGHCGGLTFSDTSYSTGAITVTGGTFATGTLIVGGSVALMESGATTTPIETRDASKPITVNVTSMNKQAYIGGVIAFFNGTTAKTRSGFKNWKPINVNLGSSTSNTAFSYVGGVSACDKANQTFSGCENYGDITVSSPHKTRLGGIASYTNKATINCKVECDITANLCEKDYSEVGGIIGYTAATDFTDCSFAGKLDTSASGSKVYTGGILGKSNGNQTFNGCSVSGALAANVNAPGLYVGGLQANGLVLTFGASTKCVVATGTTLNGVAVTELNNGNLVSQSSDGGAFASTSTLTNIVIE
ncbi:MAG: hypothetical protein IK045_02995 [Bacteroidales bacterium]|nr:hypothetical protein [Bacteroidales bacterium]